MRAIVSVEAKVEAQGVLLKGGSLVDLKRRLVDVNESHPTDSNFKLSSQPAFYKQINN